MKKSFKVRLFMHVVLIAAAVIFVNRLVGQYFLTDQLQTRIHQEMGVALTTCVDHFEDREEFVSCFKALEKGSLFSNISDFYVLCDGTKGAAQSGETAICQPLLTDSDFWRGHDVSRQGGVELAEDWVGPQHWYAVRFENRLQGPEVWLPEPQIHALMLRVWALRDRNTIYVLPTLIAMLLALTLYLTYVMMRPITSIQNNISKLTATNLDQSIVLLAPYQEFEKLVQVFDDLRIRLNDSFIKARRFASDASHELRTPLTILRGNVERLIHDLPMNSEAQVRMRNMGDEVERLIEITEKLLLLSRADANSLLQELTDVNLSDWLTRLIKDSHSFQSSLKLTSTIAPNVIWRCDKTLVHQLIYNLYANAVNYNKPQGWIHFSLKQAQGRFELTIENSAVDIPQDISERAFDRFYRGDASHTRQVDGLGLGLSICLEIAKLHQATLSLAATDRQTVLATLAAPLQRVV